MDFDPYQFVFNPLDERIYALDYKNKNVESTVWDGVSPLPERSDLQVVATPITLPFLEKAREMRLGLGSTYGCYLNYVGSHGSAGGFKISEDSLLGWRFDFMEWIPLRMRQEPTVELLPPVVVKTVPQAGLISVDPATTEIRVTFSKEMFDGSWT